MLRPLFFSRHRFVGLVAMIRFRLLALLLAAVSLAGCGAAAAPCRVTSAVLDIVPIVGHAAAAPTDACATAIDP